MSKNGNNPVMPQPLAGNDQEFLDTHEYCPGNEGFTKREEIAKAAMQGQLANENLMRCTTEVAGCDVIQTAALVAQASVIYADALLEALEK